MPLPVWSFSAAENLQPQSFQGRHLKSTQRHSPFTGFWLPVLFLGLIAHCSSQTGPAPRPGVRLRDCVRKYDHLELVREEESSSCQGLRRLLIGNICAKEKGLSLCFASAVNYLL